MGALETEKVNIAIMGAAGKIGQRIVQSLSKKNERYHLFFCEKGEIGIANLQKTGFNNSDSKDIIPKSDFALLVIIFAYLCIYKNKPGL